MRVGSSLLLCIALSLPSSLFASAEQVLSGFNPRAYEKRSVTCKATKRDAGAGSTTVDINLTYVDINPKAQKTLLLVHGWPSLWSSWAYQIQEFKDDYHLVIPDIRGFGESTHPGDVKGSGTMFDVVGDLTCILEDVGVEKAVCVGHDWGAEVCYEAARSRPDVFEGVIGGVIPYMPSAGPFLPIANLTPAFPKLTYQLYFDRKTAQAVEELNKDVRRTLRSTLRTNDSPIVAGFLESKNSYLDAWKDVKVIAPIPFFSKDEEDYFVESYEKSGFDYTLQFYTTENKYESWKFANDQGNFTISQPVLSILPLSDPVADWVKAAKLLKSEEFLPDLTTEIIEGQHWPQLENAAVFNAKMKAWLDERYPPRSERANDKEERIVKAGDEL